MEKNGEKEWEEEEEMKKFQTIVGKQVVQALRLSQRDLHDFTSKVLKGKNITAEQVDKAQKDMVSAMYSSMLLSEKDLKQKKFKI